MSVIPSARQGGLPSEPGYPFGKARNSTVPGAKDGYAFEQDYINDYIAYFSMLLQRAGLSPSGVTDTTIDGQQEQGLAELVRSSIDGLNVISAAGDLLHDVEIPVGVVASDDSRGFLALASSLTKQIDVAWAEGDAAGGFLPVGGVQADSTYFLGLIRKTSDGTIDAAFDDNVAFTNIPSGWVGFSHISTIYTDSSADISQITQREHSFDEVFVGTLSSIDGLVSFQVKDIIAGITGAVVAFASSNVPSGWLECDGTAISRTTFADLFAELGTLYGIGDGSTTFNIPDLRGRFIRGWDHGAGVDPDAGSRTDSGGGITGDNVGTRQLDELDSHTHDVPTFTGGAGPNIQANGNAGSVTIPTTAVGGNETRPINVAKMHCIKF